MPRKTRTFPDAPSLNQRCAAYGQWRDTDQWVNGLVVAINGMTATVRTDQGKELKVPYRRMTWKDRRGEWAVWSPQVDNVVTAIQGYYRKADGARSKYSRKLLPGEYVRCLIGSKYVGGFVSRTLIDGYVVSIPQEKSLVPDAGVGTWTVTSDMLAWSDEYLCWQTRFKPVKS